MGTIKGKKLLIIASPAETRSFLGPFLERTGVAATRVSTGKQCLEMAAQDRYDLIVARVPLPDLSVPALTTGFKQRFSENTNTPLVLMAEGNQHQAALAFQSGHTQVIDLAQPQPQLERAFIASLGIALRAAARLDVELEVATRRHQCRTRNISRSGMLLEATALLPVGTEFVFNFTLPERFTPIHGQARVVRHTLSTKEEVSGIGVEFVGFPDGAKEAIDSFVEHRLRAAS